MINTLFVSISSVQSLSHVRLFVTPRTAARQASLSITNSWSLLKLMSIESVMPSNHLIFCGPLLLPPSIFPSNRVFSSGLALLVNSRNWLEKKTSQFYKSVLNIHWKDWCWSWNSNTLVTWSEKLTHWERPWCWERSKAGEEDNRGWDGWMASPTRWTWVWASSRGWWWTGKPGVLQSMGSQRVDMSEQLNWTEETLNFTIQSRSIEVINIP